ncbi:DUF4190 domain-containing protein [Pedosphaera parvula]|uniref:GYF domain-containing protein n=1 Tax=Pedosphaera parvula (strain Ellin514) TaxID=320771 RepID=B9XJK8_PEDPL|nr:DUF4190 domain-containing protein [Pedosphaera parvula]EEF59884.1 hypothetical protein Cflav_PD2688 [Pedosphaera parvula Ellin514]
MYKVLGNDGKEYGPVSAEQLRQWIAQGRAVANTKLQPEGSTEWKSLSEIPEFSTAFVSAPPPSDPQPQLSGPAKTSGLAIASVICGALGLVTCITSPIGLILGISARNQIKKSDGQIKGSGLATTGIILSCVTFAIVILAFLLPALAMAKQKAQAISCIGNMHQLGIAAHLYAGSNHDKFPTSKNWSDLLAPSVGNPKAFVCPLHPTHRSSYAFNAKVGGKKQNEVAPETVLFFESDAGWNSSGGPDDLSLTRHDSRIIVCFADGSVQRLPASKLDTLRWDP